MTKAFKRKQKNVGLGYVLRFQYSTQKDKTKILNMEQLSVWRNSPSFARSIQRNINGRNRYIYHSSDSLFVFVEVFYVPTCLMYSVCSGTLRRRNT